MPYRSFRADDTPVHQALREVLANCLVNADYYGRRGVVIIKKKDCIPLLSLPFSKNDYKKVTIKTERQKNAIVEYPTEHPEGKLKNFAEILGVSQTRVKQIVYLLVSDESIEALGGNRNRTYCLKR